MKYTDLSKIPSNYTDKMDKEYNWMADVNKGDWSASHHLFDLAIDGMIQNNESAIDSDFLKMLEILIEGGANLNKKNKEGKRPLDAIRTYSASDETFNLLKDSFRTVIPDIDERMKTI